MATISGGRSTGVVSRTEGSCATVDHGQRPLDLPANLGWRRARQLSDLAKAEVQRQEVMVVEIGKALEHLAALQATEDLAER
jgi:hypothetical protein